MLRRMELKAIERLYSAVSVTYLSLTTVSGIRKIKRERRIKIIKNSIRGIIIRSIYS